MWVYVCSVCVFVYLCGGICVQCLCVCICVFVYVCGVCGYMYDVEALPTNHYRWVQPVLQASQCHQSSQD